MRIATQCEAEQLCRTVWVEHADLFKSRHGDSGVSHDVLRDPLLLDVLQKAGRRAEKVVTPGLLVGGQAILKPCVACVGQVGVAGKAVDNGDEAGASVRVLLLLYLVAELRQRWDTLAERDLLGGVRLLVVVQLEEKDPLARLHHRHATLRTRTGGRRHNGKARTARVVAKTAMEALTVISI